MPTPGADRTKASRVFAPLPARHRFTAALLLLLTVAAATVSPAVAAVPAAVADKAGTETLGTQTPGAYRMPVAGGLLAAYDPPDSFYGAGHRGIDLAAAPGTAVRAAGDGRVAFAGVVAGHRWITLVHPDGLRTSYGVLADTLVRAGEQVTAGEIIGHASGTAHPAGGPPGTRPPGTPIGTDVARAGLHVAVRDRTGAYLDPMAVLAGRWVPALVGDGAWVPRAAPTVPHYDAWDGRHRFGFVPGSPVATHPGWVFAPNPNHVIGVAGLGSRTGRLPIDLTDLGYDPADVTYLSYAGRGGHGPADDPTRDQAPYGPADTWRGVAAAAAHLRDQLRAQWRRSPGQAVDLVGHSMGGVVIAYYLLVLHDPTDPTLPPIGHVATIASPLEGADLAAAVVDARRSLFARLGIDALSSVLPTEDAGSQAIADLAVGSDLVDRIESSWARAHGHPFQGPLATGTRVFTFGGSRDPIVPEHRSGLPGAGHVVLPGAHDSVRRTEAARIALRAFLADDTVPGDHGGVGHWMSYPVGWGEQALGAGLRRLGDAAEQAIVDLVLP